MAEKNVIKTEPKANLEALKLRFDASLAAPVARSISRKAWSLDVGSFWVPVITAAKVFGGEGVQNVSNEALGAPIVAARDKNTGALRISSKGQVSFRVHPEIQEFVKAQMSGYASNMLRMVGVIQHESPEAYIAQVAAQQKAGKPTVDQDILDITAFEIAKLEAAEAERLKAEALDQAEENPVTIPQEMPIAAD
jgi:hypothetical protein